MLSARRSTAPRTSGEIHPALELGLGDPLPRGVGIVDRAGAEQQRCAPVREVRHVGGEADHALLEPRDRGEAHRGRGAQVFNLRAAGHGALEQLAHRRRIGDEANVQLSAGVGGDYVRAHATADDADVARRLAEVGVRGPRDRPHVAEHVEQGVDRGPAPLGIRRMSAGALRPERQPQRALGADRELVFRRLADDQPAAVARVGVTVRRTRADASFFFVHHEQQPQLGDPRGAQPLRRGELRGEDPLRVAGTAPVHEFVVLGRREERWHGVEVGAEDDARRSAGRGEQAGAPRR